jgi:BlaI family transcriptional regulator, penicillinase repressor
MAARSERCLRVLTGRCAHTILVPPTERFVTDQRHDSMLDAQLSRRERQIIEALYRLGEGSARDVARAIRDPAAHDVVRVTLLTLERKGQIRHRVEGRRHVYAPVQSPDKARRSALATLTSTFFAGSASRAVLALLDMSRAKLSEAELDELAAWVEQQGRTRARKSR